ncbi:MAG: DNA alkylation repair protein [Spirochaetota bacterium]
MEQSANVSDVMKVASIEAEIKALPVRNTQTMRVIRRKYSRLLKQASTEFILHLARKLLEIEAYRWIAYELIANHTPSFECLGETELEDLGRGINSWWTVDDFARTLAGPAWRKEQVSDKAILKWAYSPDRWWRRAALVSTVALNVRSRGGKGDIPRTLRICRVLVKDHDDMVVKAMSWALRELVVHDARAVQEFLSRYDHVLVARVKREVKNKLKTGLKNPKRQSRRAP